MAMTWEKEAERMVRTQILARGVAEGPLTEALRSLPRHLFVPPERRHQAWDDGPLPIGREQTISQPYMVALMTDYLGVGPGDAVLEIGTGSGYQAALLAALGCVVTSVERVASLARRAEALLRRLGLDVTVVVGDGREGRAESAPYRGIIVTAGSPRLYQAWSDQLDRGGRLVVPLALSPGLERLFIRERREEGFLDDWKEYCRFVPLLPGLDDGGDVDGS